MKINFFSRLTITIVVMLLICISFTGCSDKGESYYSKGVKLREGMIVKRESIDDLYEEYVYLGYDAFFKKGEKKITLVYVDRLVDGEQREYKIVDIKKVNIPKPKSLEYVKKLDGKYTLYEITKMLGAPVEQSGSGFTFWWYELSDGKLFPIVWEYSEKGPVYEFNSEIWEQIPPDWEWTR